MRSPFGAKITLRKMFVGYIAVSVIRKEWQNYTVKYNREGQSSKLGREIGGTNDVEKLGEESNCLSLTCIDVLAGALNILFETNRRGLYWSSGYSNVLLPWT